MGQKAISFLRSLRGRYLIVLLALTALPTLLIGTLAYQNARQTIEARVKAQLTSIADLKKEQISHWLQGTQADVRLIADNFLNEEHFTVIINPENDPQLRESFSEFITQNLISIKAAREGYSEIIFVDVHGQIILSTERANVGQNFNWHPAVQATFNSPTEAYVQDIHRADDNGEIEMVFGHVLHSVDMDTAEVLPEVNGAVLIRVRMEESIYPLIQAWPGMGATGETLLARIEGPMIVFLNPLRFDENAALALRVDQESANAKPAHYGSMGREGIIATPDYRGTEVLAAYRYIPEIDWGFVAKQDTAEAFDAVSGLTRLWVWITVVVLILAFSAAVFLTRTLTEPLQRLVFATQEVAAGNLETEITLKGQDEISALGKSFKTMISAVRESHAELRAHGEELEALFNLSQTLLGTLDVSEMLEHTLREAISGTNTQAGSLLLVSPATGELVIRAIQNLPDHMLGRRFPIDALTAPGYALLQSRPVYSSDLGREMEFNVPPFVVEIGIRSLLAVPMLVEGRGIGAIVLDDFEKREYSQDEINVAQVIANQTAVALERARLFTDLSDSYDRTLDALVAALDARDKETEGHSRRVVAYTLRIAQEMGVSENQIPTIRRGSLLHDIGKIGVPDGILHKPARLDDEEWAIMKRHPGWGEDILSGISFLDSAVEIVKSHHERWDGKGYPYGLKENQIPLGARVFAVADTFDAITSDRPYRAGRPYPVAVDELIEGRGSQFDPGVVDAFLRIPEEEWARLKAESLAPGDSSIPITSLIDVPSSMLTELEAISEMITTVSGSLELSQVLNDAARTAVSSLGVAATAVFLYDPDSDTLSLAADANLPDVFKTRFSRIPVRGLVDEEIIREGKLRIHGDIAEIEAFVEMGVPQDHPDWGEYLCVPLQADGVTNGLLGVFSRRPHTFDQSDLRLYRFIGEQIGVAISNAKQHQIVQELAITDGLTGSYNRRYLDEFLARELKRCARYQCQCGVSVLMLDLDNFKEYNDTFGHPAGDRVLKELIALIRQNVRAVDMVARYGGEEFILVLPETAQEGGYAVAEKIRLAIETYQFPEMSLTASLGVAHSSCTFVDEAIPEEIIAMADQALYSAKEKGRNRVEVWESAHSDMPRQSTDSLPQKAISD